ncbi:MULTISPECIES: helix-turn-helix transcriptional regulator [Bacillaceae]|uniref:helix-turn-helix transcriptional regulator n=1 Tax=Bacillaceae TaxID=186817 RepID=UPI000BFC9248|nr:MULTISPECIES: helix-turn-helix transcriptional regulator [Bacillaceae]MCM3162697.1 helix-turn-helix transcriptional regulator [Metabacillus litoralis]PGT80656.1 transcriptional regulator [Bacillus sp. AFS040349]
MQNKLEEIRKKHKYSQETLANMLNVSRQTIISIEKQKYNPSLVLAIKISRIFNLTVEEIFIYNQEDEDK